MEPARLTGLIQLALQPFSFLFQAEIEQGGEKAGERVG